MWLRTELIGLHLRTSNLRRRRCGSNEWGHGPHDQCYPIGEEASVDGCCWRYNGHRECRWSTAWWSFHDERELAMVLLQ